VVPGGRYDLADRAAWANLTDKGGSVILTYWPSEFSQIVTNIAFTAYAGNHEPTSLVQVLSHGRRMVRILSRSRRCMNSAVSKYAMWLAVLRSGAS